MTDSHTRRALDTLADLLLTGPAPAMDLSGRPRPTITPSSASAPAPRSDRAPDLRLIDHAPAPSHPAAAPIAEAVLLGHLPGFASPWISQYAHEMALRHHGAALLRVDGRQVRVEVFDGTSTPAPAEQPHGDEPFMNALCRIAPSVGCWLMVLDPPDAPQSRRRLSDVPRWTILTGADEAATIAAYRLLKTVTERPETIAPSAGVGMMFMGCDEQAAASAMARIERATEAFLHVPVELAGVRKQMQPARRSYVGQFELDEDPWAMLMEFIHDLTTGETQPVTEQSEPIADIADSADELRESPLRYVPPMIESPVVAAPVEAPPARAPAPAPPPQRTVAATDVPAAAAPLLSSYVKLKPMTARCPRHEEVELATDELGDIHLLMRANVEAIDSALRTLEETRRWTVEHRKLLGLTQPDRPLSPREPVIHIFTSEPREAVAHAYAAAPDARRMKVHLLKPVVIGEQTVNVHAEVC